MAPNAPGLVITLDYDINARPESGPPFCVPDDIIQTVFSPYANIQKLSSEVITGERVTQYEGLTSMDESTFYLQFNHER